MEEKLVEIELSSKTWYYKLIRFVFGNMVPDPKTMSNLCPIFWLAIAALLIVVFVVPIRFIIKAYNSYMDWTIMKNDDRIENYFSSLSKTELLDMYRLTRSEEYYNYDSIFKIPYFVRKKHYFESNILYEYASRKHLSWDEFTESLITDANAQKELENIQKEREEIRKKQDEYRRLKREQNEKVLDALNSVAKPFFSAKKSLSDALTFDKYSKVVVATKKFVGGLITVILATATFFLVQAINYLIMLIIDVWSTKAVLMGLLIIVTACIILLAFFGLMKLIEMIAKYVMDKRKQDITVWWFRPFMVLYTLGKVLLYYPLYFIFVSVIFRIIIVAIVWGIIKGFGVGFISSTGIFGEYFSKTKGDYCPGVKWVD